MTNKMVSILGKGNTIDLEKLKSLLDDEQVQAVTKGYDNLLVKANAGSGKTRVLTSRVAYLLGSGVPESHIMLLTFTRKASREMMERVEAMLGGRKVRILGGTFHSIGATFLRKYAGLLGYDYRFTILDTEDARKLINDIRKVYLKREGLSNKDFPTAKLIYHYGSSAINKNMTLEEINMLNNNLNEYMLDGVREILEAYTKRKKDANGMDFDDLIVNFLKILEIPDVRKVIANHYPFILVDEYQDINHIQAGIIRLLNRGNNHLFAVGDPNQSIYGWRGSEVSYIEHFEKRFLGSETLYITRNYRSDAHILALAEYSINQNYVNKKNQTHITPVRPSQNKPTVCLLQNEYEQAEHIASSIKKYLKKGVPPQEIAVLIRKNRQSMALEKVFRREGVSYKLSAGMSFFEQKHVKDLMAFLRFADNPKDEVAFTRMAKFFEGLGEKIVENLYTALKDGDYKIEYLRKVKVSSKAKQGLATMLSILEEITQPSYGVKKMIGYVLSEFYDHYLKMTEEDYEERKQDLDYLYKTSEKYTSLSDFLTEMVLDDTEQDEDSDDVVTISTVHKAKGLEWDCVFVPSLNEGEFSIGRNDTEEEAEEERRVFYVAVTRARKHLHMSYVEYIEGSYASLRPSCFLEELQPAHTVEIQPERRTYSFSF